MSALEHPAVGCAHRLSPRGMLVDPTRTALEGKTLAARKGRPRNDESRFFFSTTQRTPPADPHRASFYRSAGMAESGNPE